MKIGTILEDSLRYPLSNLKNLLIFGFILVIADLYAHFLSVNNITLTVVLGILGLIFALISYGYEIKIIKSTLDGYNELPEFNQWFSLFKDGIKLFLVVFIYLIPIILIIFATTLLLGLGFGIKGTSIMNNINIIFLGVIAFILLIYIVILLPLVSMALANMVNNNSRIGEAFRFGIIRKIISNLGWGNLVVWYIAVGIICLVLMFVGGIILIIFNILHLKLVGSILYPFYISYMTIFFYRSVALFYKSGMHTYLECENCGGYYKLKYGESLEDFETCQCGGKLNYQQKKE